MLLPLFFEAYRPILFLFRLAIFHILNQSARKGFISLISVIRERWHWERCEWILSEILICCGYKEFCKMVGILVTAASHAWISLTHSLTHSLTNRPSSMRAGDSRRPLRYISSHCTLSCDISFRWIYLQPVHSSMSCIHCLLGLPWCRNPSIIPSRTKC